MAIDLSPPSADEIEVNVFGPGFGESILIHVGQGRWIVFDSCLDTLSGRPAAAKYLDEIGVDCDDIVLIAATHWHDDHIRGIASLLRTAPNAAFACPFAFGLDDFIAVAEAYHRRHVTVAPGGMAEIYEAFSELRLRNKTPIFAKANTPLFPITPDPAVNYRVTSLSPHDVELTTFLRMITAFAIENDGIRRIPPINDNDISMAAWVEIGETKLLLGADLLEHQRSDRGWSAVVESGLRPRGQASIYKVSHHGSHTGHHDQIWPALLTATPVAVLTPWNRGKKLPQPADIDRLRKLGQGYATARATTRSFHSQIAPVEKTIREIGAKIETTASPTGQVRMRAGPAGTWRVDLSANACSLLNY